MAYDLGLHCLPITLLGVSILGVSRLQWAKALKEDQEGQLSVSGERMCTILVNHLED